MVLIIETTAAAPCPVVHVTGELDIASAPRLGEVVLPLVDQGHRRMVIDLSGLSFLDSSGIGMLVRIVNALGEGGRLGLAGAQPRVARVLALTGLSDHLEVHDTVGLAQLRVCGDHSAVTAVP